MATTIPSYNPGSFTNPQRIIDKSFDAFIEGGEKMVNKIATTADQIYERNRIEKETQKLEWEKQNQEQQKLYSSVNELGSTGSSSLDNNLRAFWDGRVDDYFKIKNAMQRGDMPQQEGNRLLASINGEVDKFKTVVPYLAQQVQLQREAGKIQPGSAGAISSVTSTESQQVLNNLMNGGDTGLVSKGGNMFLYNPAVAGKQNGGMLNIDELISNQATGKSIVQTVPDISKDLSGAFNNIFKPDDVASEYVKFKTEKNKDGSGYDYTYKTIEEDKKLAGIQAMKDNGQFNPLLNDEKMMTSVWQDMIPDEYLKANGVNPDSSWMMIDPNKTPAENEAEQDKMREIATNWLADKAYEDNSQMDQGALKFVSKQKSAKPSSSSSSGGGSGGGGGAGFKLSQENQLVYNTRRPDYDNIVKETTAIYEKKDAKGNFVPPSVDEYITLLNAANPGKEYFKNDNGLIQSDKKIIPIPTNKEEAIRYLNTISGIDREVQILFEDNQQPTELTVEDYLNG